MIVNRVSEPNVALTGVLWQSRGSWLTLKQPSILESGQAPKAIDGDVTIHRSQVAFIQVLP